MIKDRTAGLSPIVLTLVSIIIVALGPFTPGTAQEARNLTGLVVWVYDGDSLLIETSGRRVRVRLFGIDAPEKNQDYSRAALKYVIRKAKGRTVRLKVRDVDDYGRLVALVTLPDGTSLNHALLKNGLAWHFRRYSDDPEMARLEAEARAGRRGLWKDPRPTPPWEYRK